MFVIKSKKQFGNGEIAGCDKFVPSLQKKGQLPKAFTAVLKGHTHFYKLHTNGIYTNVCDPLQLP